MTNTVSRLIIVTIGSIITISVAAQTMDQDVIRKNFESLAKASAVEMDEMKSTAKRIQIISLIETALVDFRRLNLTRIIFDNEKQKWTNAAISDRKNPPAEMYETYLNDRSGNPCRVTAEVYDKTGTRNCLPFPFTRYCKGEPYASGDMYEYLNNDFERIVILSGSCTDAKTQQNLKSVPSAAVPLIENSDIDTIKKFLKSN